MEMYEAPRMEVIEIEKEIGTLSLPCHGQDGNQDAGSTPMP